jgi:hypothetical protein
LGFSFFTELSDHASASRVSPAPSSAADLFRNLQSSIVDALGNDEDKALDRELKKPQIDSEKSKQEYYAVMAAKSRNPDL